MNSSIIGNIGNYLESNKITHLVVHGLKTSDHTHRYIHKAIYNTFLYIADKIDRVLVVLWCDDTLESQHIYKPTNKYLIFSTPHLETDKFLPVICNAYYILHYRKCVVYTDVPITKYDALLQSKRAVKYVELRYSIDHIKSLENDHNRFIKLGNTPFWFDPITNEAHMAWATNLFPKDIDTYITKIEKSTTPTFKPRSYFCGSVWRVNNDELDHWKLLCKKHDIECVVEREPNEFNHQMKVSESMLAPAIQGATQRGGDNKYYIPCRIFKNISYGAIPITNNIGVYNMMKDYEILYDSDLETLMDKCRAYHEYILHNYEEYKKKQVRIMEHVRDHHTFLNRLDTLIQYGFD